MKPTHIAAASILAFAVQGAIAQTATTDKDKAAATPSSPPATTQAPATPSASGTMTGADAKQAARASRLIGLNIKNADGDTIGEIKDMTVDASTGQVQQVVVGVGGFLGIGQKDVALNWSDLKIQYEPPQTVDRGAAPTAGMPATRDGTATPPAAPAPTAGTSAPAAGMSAERRDAAVRPGALRLTVNMTKEQLQNAPEFEMDAPPVRSGPPAATR